MVCKQERFLISRADAKARGLTRYFTGRPCKFGHVAHRTILSGNCVECLLIFKTKVRDPVARKTYYQENRERERATNRAYMRRHRARLSDLAKKYREENRGRLSERNAAWRRSNPEYAPRHQRENRDNYRVYYENRRSRRLSSGKLSTGIIEKLMVLQRGRCAACRKQLGNDRSLDHITPLSKGGRNVDANVQLMHGRCNSQKGRRDPIEFMRSRGLLL